jgi:hypothetical protein
MYLLKGNLSGGTAPEIALPPKSFHLSSTHRDHSSVTSGAAEVVTDRCLLAAAIILMLMILRLFDKWNSIRQPLAPGSRALLFFRAVKWFPHLAQPKKN